MMPRMRNVHIYVDVDLTLIDELGRLLPSAVEGLLTLREAGCRLFLWSTCGADYCRDVATKYELLPLFDAFLPKPDIYIDDMPSTIFRSLVYDVNSGKDWQQVADEIKRKHVAKPPPAPRPWKDPTTPPD
jgi:hypothetical protein